MTTPVYKKIGLYLGIVLTGWCLLRRMAIELDFMLYITIIGVICFSLGCSRMDIPRKGLDAVRIISMILSRFDVFNWY
ncbi:hypothetical protein BW12_10745 [Bifidobacterium sp. UTCIF-3]|nr:hypothetical protein BW09_10580 [Bifidobacterium sp. UTCIF-1]TPF79241.1 hypothetical protein BW08_11120 [Bifidobacterium sp. UTCIF-24]TPF81315.1 hypothetical protein BW12_10745 [Bifidobacterium sp. UTCIF-3]TPF83360.1 hypothetical protein BW07_10700 [Bifidobacterium sp. UTCIF-36]TPF87816.1 hypothetical protein BW10_10955 [Bifidobacterium sp. UTBIF-56]